MSVPIRVMWRCLFVISIMVGSLTVTGSASHSALAQQSTHRASLARIGLTPQQIRQAYDINPLLARGDDGRGQTIAFIEIDGYSDHDLAAFNQRYHLPPTHVTRYAFDRVRRRYHPATAAEANQPGLETSLDLEWAHAVAPRAHLAVYEISTPTLQDLLGSGPPGPSLNDAIRAAIDSHPSAISISLGAGGLACFTFLASYSLGLQLARAAAQDIAVFASSGDSGDSQVQCFGARGTSYPASDPNVTAVGGTTLLVDAQGNVASETAWSGSGGGINTTFTRPLWQRGPGLPANHSRYLPDVAFDADPLSGVEMITAGIWHVVGGTSLGAPCWAAIWALLLQVAPQFGEGSGGASPPLYALANSSLYSSVFYDITSGSNGAYSAGTGWDAVTGWGSPNVAALVRHLASGQGWRLFGGPLPPPAPQ